MIWLILILAAGTMLILAVFMACVLGWANKTFHIDVDPRVEAVNEALPGANCGGCGFVGCGEYAEAVVAGQAAPNLCTVGGATCAKEIAAILGVELGETFPYRPAVHCGARYGDRLQRHGYRQGDRTCAAANLVGGIQGCTYGCLGFGDCQAACDYDALYVRDGLAEIDYEKCVGCGACARACPRNVITMVPFKADRVLVVACSSRDFGKGVRAVCKVGCLGCGACQRLSDLFTVEDNISRIDYDAYDSDEPEAVRKAIAKCPAKRLVHVGKPSPEDLAAVAEEQVAPVVEGKPGTTVDKTRWQG